METPAVYDLQTEKFARPAGERYTLGAGERADVVLPVDRPWGNRGGTGNAASLLAGVEAVRATVFVADGTARVVPAGETATVYVTERAVGAAGTEVRNAESVILGDAKSGLWTGYRVQLSV